MKSLSALIFLFLLCAVAGQSRFPNILDIILARSRDRVNKQFINLLESQRDHFPVGWPSLGIPPLDPFYINDLELSIETISTLTSINFRLSDANLVGLQGFKIEKFDVRFLFGTSLKFQFYFDELTIKGFHSTKANLVILPIAGEGPITMVFRDVRINGAVEVDTLDGGYLNLKELSFNSTIGSSEVEIRGFGAFIDNNLSSLLSTSLPSLINESSEAINDSINKRFLPRANKFLNQYRLIDIFLAIITRSSNSNLTVLEK